MWVDLVKQGIVDSSLPQNNALPFTILNFSNKCAWNLEHKLISTEKIKGRNEIVKLKVCGYKTL